MNSSRDSHSIHIRITDDDANTILQETFNMEGRTAKESNPLNGTPSTVQVAIDSDEAQKLAWPVESGDRVEEASIRYDPYLETTTQEIYISTVIA